MVENLDKIIAAVGSGTVLAAGIWAGLKFQKYVNPGLVGLMLYPFKKKYMQEPSLFQYLKNEYKIPNP